ncbi:MAG: hypothetical protein HY708_00965 [Ignavibacteriae bacterium]|nr:hypothetical protein [Ignavibacteriota bacterium]
MRTKRIIALCLILLFAQGTWGQVDSVQGPYERVHANVGEFCTVCGVPLTENDVALIVRGRRVPLNNAMVDEFLQHEEKYFAKLQPKGALFQEEADAPPGTAQGGISKGWFLFGLCVLVALLFGGMSGYNAISKGLSPIPHFFIGFVFNILGYLYVLSRPRKTKHGEVPSGLVKVPNTSAPVRCPSCGYTNHPSAKKCSACRTPLNPVIESEASRVLSHRE